MSFQTFGSILSETTLFIGPKCPGLGSSKFVIAFRPTSTSITADTLNGWGTITGTSESVSLLANSTRAGGAIRTSNSTVPHSAGLGYYSLGFMPSKNPVFECRLALPSVTSTTTCYMGFRSLQDDSWNAGDCEAVDFTATDGGNWFGYSDDTIAQSNTDLGVATAADTLVTLRLELTSSLATFYINGTSVGTLNTHLPGSTTPLMPQVQVSASATRNIDIVYAFAYQDI